MGSILRLLLLAIAIWIVLRVAQAWLRKYSSRPNDTLADAKTMLRCSHCGVFVPRSEAHFRDDRVYCSQEHLRQSPPPQ